MPKSLKIAAIHLAVDYGHNSINRQNIVELACQAADNGASIVVAPEMSLTGYCFENRDAIAPFTEAVDGPSGKEFSRVSQEKKIYLIAAFAERVPETGIFYNAAFVWDPEGKLVCHYRKINAESRWACPGEPKQNNIFQTPWGKAGLLICSDSYHSLPTRVTALKGADIVFLPANWPPTHKFPENIWKFRALENGIYFVAVNRTGREETFDCTKSVSYIIRPDGEIISSASGPDSLILEAELPLDQNGKLAGSTSREKILKTRKPYIYHRLFATLLFFKNISGSLKLPDPRPIDTHFISSGDQNPVDFLENISNQLYPVTLTVLPLYPYTDSDLTRLENLSKIHNIMVLTATEETETRVHIAITKDGLKKYPYQEDTLQPLVFLGPLAIQLTRKENFLHPEVALSAAKYGADLLLAIEKELSPQDRFRTAMRTIDQLAAGIVSRTGSVVALIPEGHVPGRGAYAPAGSYFTYTLDARDLRNKSFQDRIDYETLFAGGGIKLV
ncbi:MAG: carbon-nitrogen hydrolase family protein [Deltaproteobacteria bacterium]|jgi:predicted amidohydrolase|nr:carbon-nitrogen hydrolase family protein [Deltaproteobacteria bacterium]